jgi:signal transduction histidine kinase
MWAAMSAAEPAKRPGYFLAAAAGSILALGAAAISTWRMRAARREAAAAEKARNEFLANISHEFRTRLNGVLGMTGLLLDTELDSEQRENTEMIRKSGECLLSVVNDVQDFSRLESGRITLEKYSLDLRVVIEEVMDLVQPQAEGKPVDLIVDYPSSVPGHFLGDGGRVRQILVPLAGNAVKFTRAGHVSVSVAFQATEGRDGCITISVLDTESG